MENENQEVIDSTVELDVKEQAENQIETNENLEVQAKAQNQEIAQNMHQKQENFANSGSKIKKKFNFKLFLSIVYVTLLVGAITLISVLYALNNSQAKDFNFGFNDPAYIKIHTADKTSSANNQIFANGTEQYQKLMSLYDKSFVISLKDATLQGKAQSGVTAKEGFKSISASSLNGTYIEFCYNEIQEVYLNGEKYEANIVGDESYYVIVIEVVNSDTLAEINAYFKYKTNSSSEYSYVRFTSFAAQAELYNYIENSL